MEQYKDYKQWKPYYNDGKYRKGCVIIYTQTLDYEKADKILKDQKETYRRISALKAELKELESLLSKITKEKCECGVHESVDSGGYDESCSDCGLRW